MSSGAMGCVFLGLLFIMNFTVSFCLRLSCRAGGVGYG